MVIVYFDTSLLEYESEPGIPPYFLRLVGPIQLYLHWSQKTLVHIADAYPCHATSNAACDSSARLMPVNGICCGI